MECIGNSNTHRIHIIFPDDSKEFKCPYILAIPHEYKEGDSIILESNNQESSPKIVTSAVESTIDSLFSILYHSQNKNPILVPLLPSNPNGIPYYQQLSIECFDETLARQFYRIDSQVVSMIEDAKKIISGLKGKKVGEQVILNGYSSSGVFAQRFALLHPELVKAACIGGAIGSMPLPITEYKGKEIGYPLGIADYERLTGKKFDIESYKKINFHYYVAEGENERKSETRFTEDNEPAPMCDMSYMARSVPPHVGQTNRDCFGRDSFERFHAQLVVAEDIGLSINYHQPYPGLNHHNINDAAHSFIGSCITESNNLSENNKENTKK